jgi:hypothetical protein
VHVLYLIAKRHELHAEQLPSQAARQATTRHTVTDGENAVELGQ